MNHKYRRLSAAALAFVFCLMVVPVTTAQSARNRDRFEVREPIFRAPIVRIVQKIKLFLGQITRGQITLEDEVPGPPHP